MTTMRERARAFYEAHPCLARPYCEDDPDKHAALAALLEAVERETVTKCEALAADVRERCGDSETAAEIQRAIRALAPAREACSDLVKVNELREEHVRMARWIDFHAEADGKHVHDHACAKCLPDGGPLVIEGFVCAVHIARAIVAWTPKPGDRVEMVRADLWPGMREGTRATVIGFDNAIGLDCVKLTIDGYGSDFVTNVKNVRRASST